jgi:signal transduction histidine kinase
MNNAIIATRRLGLAAAGAGALTGLMVLAEYNYLVFHSLVELCSIVVCLGIFTVAWNARRYFDSNFFIVLGIGFLFVGGVDLLHTLAYKGMGVFAYRGADLATQLWIAERYMLALSFVLALGLLKRRLTVWPLFVGYAAAFVLTLLAIFQWHVFPTCFNDTPGANAGLTPFKQISELVIVGILALGLWMLHRNRAQFDSRVRSLIAWSLGATMAAELCFVRYGTNIFGASNEIGHILTLVAVYLLYEAFIATGIRKPFRVLFRGLKRGERELRQARDELEVRVRQRTSELASAVDQLQEEVRGRILTEEQLLAERQKIFAVLNMIPGYVKIVDRNYSVRFANQRYVEMFGDPAGRPCHAVQFGRGEPCENCPSMRVLQSKQPADWEWTSPAGRTYLVRSYPFADTDGAEGALSLGMDVTEHRDLERRVIEVGERERRRIGRDLHDTLGQNLTALAFLIKALARDFTGLSAGRNETADQIVQLVNESVSQVRSIARGLDPVGIHEEGLAASLRELADGVEKLFHVPCRFRCDDQFLLKGDLAAANLYHIAQEAVNNAVKHAQARRIDITVTRDDRGILLAIADDGVGLPAHLSGTAGLGLHTMQYRANMIGASLSVAPGSGGGTVVTCVLPQPEGRRR